MAPPGAQLQVVLADASGRVLYDGLRNHPGRRLTSDERSAAQDVLAEGQLVGRLVVTVPVRSSLLGPLEQSFVVRLRWLLGGGALVAGGLGVLLGVAFSRSLAAPLQRLAAAAGAVARRDFSQRVKVEGSAELADLGRAFNDMATALEQSEQQRQSLVADVAHELRTPLSVLQGNLRAILDDVYPLDKAEVARLYDETRLLGRMVEDLQDLALADAGQLRLHLQPSDVAGILRATADSLGLAAEAQEVALSVHIPDEAPLSAVQADPDRLAQVLRNLLVNALRHTPAGGTVTVTAAEKGGVLEVAVADTGEGIAAQDLPYVFDRFWRAERSRARGEGVAGGSGLGLSVARSLVEAHGGRIWVESQVGQGTTFRFTLLLGDGVRR
jgi:two-component system OmpR family sensor kinase